ncbi:MAG: hypothetical protein OEZ65_02840 [Gemmatimonadota bacterium]|nr:hypothetical protein [Gemmatimonadota bacterium]MDH5758500.1 hypothetical protein [Gemmatimonadota bacterium]
MTTRAVIRALTGLALVGTVACNRGPEGPGPLEARIVGDPLPAGAVVQVTGLGIRGFESRGDTHVYGTAAPSGTGPHRVVVIGPAAAELRFGIQVDDRRAELPVVTLSSAVDASNRSILVGGLEVRLSRK